MMIAVIAAIAAIVGAVLSRRSASESNAVSEFKETIAGMKALQERQDERIGALELELTTVKTAWAEEQRGHRTTRGLFRVATRHIRDLMAWLDGERFAEPPSVPEQLSDWV